MASCGFAVMKNLLCTLAIPQAMLTSGQGSSEGTRYPIDEPGPQRLTVHHADSADVLACVKCSKVGLEDNHIAGSSYPINKCGL